MERQFETYDKWEDYNCGMYSLVDTKDKDKKVIGAIYLLSNQVDFLDTMKEILIKWETSCKVNLSNRSQNRRAWLGAAACMYKYQTPEYLTRIAWSLLNKDVQFLANETADKIIKHYEEEVDRIRENMGAAMLF